MSLPIYESIAQVTAGHGGPLTKAGHLPCRVGHLPQWGACQGKSLTTVGRLPGRVAYHSGALTRAGRLPQWGACQGRLFTTVGRLLGQVAYHSGAPTRAGGFPQWGAYQGGSAKQKRSKGKQKAEDRYVGELGQKEHFGIEGGREKGGREKGGRGWIWQMITKTYREREMEKSEERIRCGRH